MSQSLGWEDPSILAWRIPWTEDPGYSPWGRKEWDTTEATSHTHTPPVNRWKLFPLSPWVWTELLTIKRSVNSGAWSLRDLAPLAFVLLRPWSQPSRGHMPTWRRGKAPRWWLAPSASHVGEVIVPSSCLEPGQWQSCELMPGEICRSIAQIATPQNHRREYSLLF